ncbi:transposase [Paraburkholderia sp. MM6662-R1]
MIVARLSSRLSRHNPASIPVERHKRRAKTDRLDAIKLVMNLRAWLRGERDRMHVVHVPSPQDEASRQLMRDRGQLQKEVLQHRDRMRKLLATLGCWDEVDHRAFAGRLARNEVKCHDGTPLPPELRERLLRECERLALAQQQLATLEKTRKASVSPPARERSDALARLKGIGEVGASRLALELFWREFSNRRQVGACVGLVPQPYDSGQSHTDQGISRQGNRRVRALLVEMAWTWLRYQPGSALTQWFDQRTQGTGANRRARRIAIVAVARRLAIALWRYLKDGIIPEGAQLKSV